MSRPTTHSCKPVIWHLSADFPDPIMPEKTPVFRRLVDLTAGYFDHRVFSLNRASPGIMRRPFLAGLEFEYGYAAQYAAPGKGIFHHTILRRLGDRLARHLASGPRPELLVGHKLTIEGVAIARAARLLDVPYALTIQGDSDLKVMAARPDLKPQFAQIFHGAACVFVLAPWTLAAVEERLGRSTAPVRLMPCPAAIEDARPADPTGDGLISIFHLRHARRKNLARIAAAFEIMRRNHPDETLTVIGGGDGSDFRMAARMIPPNSGISFEGHLDAANVRTRLTKATGFVLPSRRESFGLVFIEALMHGLPIIYPAGAAVDGYFDGLPFALRVDARSSEEIAAAMETLIGKEAALKGSLNDWQQSASARRFFDSSIRQTFAAGLNQALATG